MLVQPYSNSCKAAVVSLLRNLAASCHVQFWSATADNTSRHWLHARLKSGHDYPICALQIALDALLKVFSDPDWHHCFSQLASQVLSVGPSHRAHLVALKLLPAQSLRGFALQQAAVAVMLQQLCTMSSKVEIFSYSLASVGVTGQVLVLLFGNMCSVR